MTERELIVPLRQERELQRRVKELEEGLQGVRTALQVIRTCLKADDGQVGEYWTARQWLRDHGRYEGNLQGVTVPLEVAEVALRESYLLLSNSGAPKAER